jgi:hypothetical protein
MICAVPRAKLELLPGTAFMPGGGGEWNGSLNDTSGQNI